jgi:hypothetical protein
MKLHREGTRILFTASDFLIPLIIGDLGTPPLMRINIVRRTMQRSLRASNPNLHSISADFLNESIFLGPTSTDAPADSKVILGGVRSELGTRS